MSITDDIRNIFSRCKSVLGACLVATNIGGVPSFATAEEQTTETPTLGCLENAKEIAQKQLLSTGKWDTFDEDVARIGTTYLKPCGLAFDSGWVRGVEIIAGHAKSIEIIEYLKSIKTLDQGEGRDVIDPTYIWGQMTTARGLLSQGLSSSELIGTYKTAVEHMTKVMGEACGLIQEGRLTVAKLGYNWQMKLHCPPGPKG